MHQPNKELSIFRPKQSDSIYWMTGSIKDTQGPREFLASVLTVSKELKLYWTILHRTLVLMIEHSTQKYVTEK